MNIVFLDIDGVLNHWKYLKKMSAFGCKPEGTTTEAHIDSECVGRLNSILEETDAKVVVSSTWRMRHTQESLQEVLEKKGFKGEIIGFTTTYHMGCRGNQIAKYLYQFVDDIDAFVILDDDSDMSSLHPYLVQTSLFEEGLKDVHVEEAIDILMDVKNENLKGVLKEMLDIDE